jgi:ATP-dependent DNA helicase RecG
LVPGQEALVLVEVRSVNKRPLKGGKSMITVSVGDGSGRLTAVFFNQPWRAKQLTVGLQVALFGKADTYRGALQMTNPIVDLIGDRTGRIVPIYGQSEKAGISTWKLAGWIENALERCKARGLLDPVPGGVLAAHGLIDRTLMNCCECSWCWWGASAHSNATRAELNMWSMANWCRGF